MDEDRLEEILGRARGSGHRDKLVEVGRRRGAHPSSSWWWSSGRVRAVITSGKVAIAREYGAGGGGPGTPLDHGELRAIARLCRLWESVRHRWASFDTSSAGLPGAMARDFLYQPPGKNAPLVVVGRWRMGRSVGADFAGADELVLAPPASATGPSQRSGDAASSPARRLARSSAHLRKAEARRRAASSPARRLARSSAHLRKGLVVDARRDELRVVRLLRAQLLVLECGAEDDRLPWLTRDDIIIEADEAAFVRALVGCSGAPSCDQSQSAGASDHIVEHRARYDEIADAMPWRGTERSSRATGPSRRGPPRLASRAVPRRPRCFRRAGVIVSGNRGTVGL